MSTALPDGAALSSNGDDRDSRKTGLVPIVEAAGDLGRSPWTLKRLYKLGHVPIVMIGDQWLVPASFIAMVLASPLPGRAAVFEEVAQRWFALHSADTEAVTA